MDNDSVSLTNQESTGQDTVIDLASPQTQSQLKQYLDEAVTFGYVDRAHRLFKALNKWRLSKGVVEGGSTRFERDYGEMFDVARGVALPVLPDDEVMSFFQKGILAAIRNPLIDINGKVIELLLRLMFVDERDNFKKKMRFALRQNYQRVTLQGISTSIGIVAPTVKEWLDLAEKHAAREPDEPFAIMIISEPHYKTLTKEEQRTVLRLMSLDDLLSLPSDSVEGFEQVTSFVGTDGHRYVFDHGVVRSVEDSDMQRLLKMVDDISKNKTPSAPGTTVQKQTDRAQLETSAASEIRNSIIQLRRRNIQNDETRYAEEEKLLEEIGADIEQAVSRLSNGLLVNDAKIVLASLGVLSRSGAIEIALKNAQLRNAFVEEFVVKLIPKDETLQQRASAYVHEHPDDVHVIGAFVQWVMSRAVSGDEAARIGNQIENTLAALGRPEFVGLTYFDVKSGSFKWTPLKMKADGGLEWMG